MVRDGHTLDESQTASHSSLQSQCKGFPSSWTELSEATLENTVLFRPEETDFENEVSSERFDGLRKQMKRFHCDKDLRKHVRRFQTRRMICETCDVVVLERK